MSGTYCSHGAIPTDDSTGKGLERMAKLLRFIVGPQPVLRLIALLLAVIAALLYLIRNDIRALDIPTPCGDSSYQPCHVEIERGY